MTNMDDSLFIVTIGSAKIETVFTKKSYSSEGRTFFIARYPNDNFYDQCQPNLTFY
jgi:hypothetical protein